MNRTKWIFPTLVLAGLVVLVVWIQQGQSQPQAPAVMIDNAVTLIATATSQPELPTTTATSTGMPTTATATSVPSATPTIVNLTPLPTTISGVVVNANGAVAGAIVQLHGQPAQFKTAKDGTFVIHGITGTTPLVITAWSAGHYNGSTTVNPSAPDWKGGQGLTITLKSYYTADNNLYSGFSFEGVSGSASCGLCHREYKEWQVDAHAQAAINPRFISMYTGSDVNGNPGQLTELDEKGAALPLDPNEPYHGPGFQLDNPGRAGNCATCHTPQASRSPNNQNCSWSGCHTSLTIDRSRGVIAPHAVPLSLKGDAGEGINCDFCHKIGDVTIDPKTKLPPPDMPGILSMRLYRPEEGEQLFFGTLVDVPRRDTYLPLLSQSEYCAPCHYGVFGGVVGPGTVTGGTVIYNSYGEWLESPYSDPKTGKTCQQCHMTRSDADWFVYAERGGLTRDYAELHNHTMPGVTDEKLLQNSVTMKSTARRAGDQIKVEVSITNDNVGHDIPTDSPIRSLILVVEALDENGNVLSLTEGPINPAYSGNFGGQPGKTFAKILKDEWTGETPTGAYWRPVSIVEDTRLAALATDVTRYSFATPTKGAATIKVRLLFRRAFQLLAEQKGWNDADIVMEEVIIAVAASE
jgi:hypothetical protein